jgi:DNA mismatch repair protein MutS
MTPLMQQYWEIKSGHADKVLLFRMGDFYEMFHKDAETAAPILNIALTQRNKKSADQTKMCGVPYHSIAGPIAKLLRAGHRIAICDQIEDPALAKGIVKRAVTRVLTPGMVYDPETLDEVTANYLASYDATSVAFADITTGETFYYRMHAESEREEILSLLTPVELVLSHDMVREDDGSFLISRFESAASATDRLIQYIQFLQGEEVAGSLRPFEERSLKQNLRLSATTLQHLEVFETARGERSPTLFSCMDRTRTSPGARLLKNRLAFPLINGDAIAKRQDKIARWIQNSDQTKRVRELLKNLGDIERRMGKLVSSTVSCRDLLALAESIKIGLEAILCQDNQITGFDSIAKLSGRLLLAIVDSPPLTLKEGGMIRRGVRTDLDELIDLSENAQALLTKFEMREKEQTKISTLKVRYNNVFGFYIELTKMHAEKAPEHYRRKQTLVNAERFTTPELAELEEKILSARARRGDLEYEIYLELRAEVLRLTPEILDFAKLLAEMDVDSSLAWLAMERGYRRPKLGSERLRLTHSRHPVVEQERLKTFIPNTIVLEKGGSLLLTGPNMAGKSTLMRQVAVIAIMAQMGSFVPVEEAELPLFTQLFSRIGASDLMSEGLSTFMVEMKETAEIIKAADSRSLIIMDEIGRGTSTYDGLSLAQAILEYLIKDKRPYLFFATHYQELTALPEVWPQIQNGHMSVQEKRGEIVFLHTLKAGPANRSYGIHVARLAELPTAVTLRAEKLLAGFESERAGLGPQLSLIPILADTAPQISAEFALLLDEIKSVDLSKMTPLEALNMINGWQQKLT